MEKIKILETQIEAVKQQKAKIDSAIYNYFTQLCEDFYAEIDLDEIQIEGLHPYIRIGSTTAFTERKPSESYRIIGNDGVNVEMHPSIPPIVRVYVTSNILIKLNTKLYNEKLRLQKETKVTE